MAFVFVYLQRHSLGIHPASVLGLCAARDFASRRGASVLALCEGQDERHDKLVTRQAGQYGADQLIFCDRGELASMYDEFGPRVVWSPATPWSEDALAAMTATAEAQGQTTQSQKHWLTAPEVIGDEFPPLVQVYAGVLPWVDFSTELLPQDRRRFEADEISLEETLPDSSSAAFARPPLRIPKARPRETELYYFNPGEDSGGATDSELQDLSSALSRLGAKSVPDPAEVPAQQLCVWLGRNLPTGLPSAPSWCLVPGVNYTDDFCGWEQADWVFPGPRDEALGLLQSRIWKNIYA